MLVEVQALAAKAGFGTPQRVATGYDGRRLALLLAVLDKRAGLSFAQLDVFLNVVGGVRLQEPAGDLAVAAALASSVYDRAAAARRGRSSAKSDWAARSARCRRSERRIAEAANMGMRSASYLAERGVPKRGGATDVESSACARSASCSSGCSRDRRPRDRARATSAS